MTDPADPEPKTPADTKSATHDAPDPDATTKAKDELFVAIEHFKNAASILFDRAAKDPSLRSATHEAERVMQKVGATAEPLARSLAGELSKLTRQVADAVDGRRKSDVPPPRRDTPDKPTE
jgi:hypothetical protein